MWGYFADREHVGRKSTTEMGSIGCRICMWRMLSASNKKDYLAAVFGLITNLHYSLLAHVDGDACVHTAFNSQDWKLWPKVWSALTIEVAITKILLSFKTIMLLSSYCYCQVQHLNLINLWATMMLTMQFLPHFILMTCTQQSIQM